MSHLDFMGASNDIYACRKHVLSRVDPRVLVLTALAGCLAVIFSTRSAFPLIVLPVCIIVMLWVRVPTRTILARLLTPLGIVLTLMALRPFTLKGTPVLTLAVAGHSFVATREGLAASALLGLRILAAVSIQTFLSLACPVHKLLAVLHWLRLPRSWVEVATLMARYALTLSIQARAAFCAQRARLGYATLGRSLRSVGPLAGMILLRSIEQSERTHQAMVLRGYRGTLPVVTLPPLRWSQRLALVLLPATVALLCFFCERWPG